MTLVQKLLPYLSLDWLTVLFDLYRLLRRWLKKQWHEGIYEILNYDSTLELLNAKGKRAIFPKRQRVKHLFCQNESRDRS